MREERREERSSPLCPANTHRSTMLTSTSISDERSTKHFQPFLALSSTSRWRLLTPPLSSNHQPETVTVSMATSEKVPVRLSAPICGVFMLELTGFGDYGRLGPTAAPSETGRCDWLLLIAPQRRFCRRADEQTRRLAAARSRKLQEQRRYFYIAAAEQLKFSRRSRYITSPSPGDPPPTPSRAAAPSSRRLNRHQMLTRAS